MSVPKSGVKGVNFLIHKLNWWFCSARPVCACIYDSLLNFICVKLYTCVCVVVCACACVCGGGLCMVLTRKVFLFVYFNANKSLYIYINI